MSIALKLREMLYSGVFRIGEVEIHSSNLDSPYVICHYLDSDRCRQADSGGLESFDGPSAARDLSTYADDGSYRFMKAKTNLRRGCSMTLRNEEDLRLALDQFYPAAVGMLVAQSEGNLQRETLRSKLERQTGMYRSALAITNEGAQRVVQRVCGPSRDCAKKILWNIDENTPLDECEASRFEGIVGNIEESRAVPLLCREACNHLVAECRKEAKAERLSAQEAK